MADDNSDIGGAEGVRTGVKADDTTLADAVEASFRDGFQRTAEAFGEFGDYGRENLDAVMESISVATQGAEAISANAVAFARTSMEEGARAAQSLAAARSVQELATLQADYARAALQSCVGEFIRTADLMADLMKDAWKPLNERAATAWGAAGAR